MSCNDVLYAAFKKRCTFCSIAHPNRERQKTSGVFIEFLKTPYGGKFDNTSIASGSSGANFKFGVSLAGKGSFLLLLLHFFRRLSSLMPTVQSSSLAMGCNAVLIPFSFPLSIDNFEAFTEEFRVE